MSMFSKPFRTPTQRQIQEIFDRAEKKTEKEMRPVRELSLAIIRASMNCLEGTKPLLNDPDEEAPDEKQRQLAEISAWYEFISFHLHLMIRSAFAQMSEDEIKHLRAVLGWFVVAAAVDSYFGHWPDEYKRKIIGDVLEHINDAEMAYAKCSQFDSPAPPEERSLQVMEALFTLLGQRVAFLTGHEKDFLLPILITNIVLKEYSAIPFDKLIEDFRRDSMGLRQPPYRPD